MIRSCKLITPLMLAMLWVASPSIAQAHKPPETVLGVEVSTV